MKTAEDYMSLALKEAKKAMAEGEVPVGAVIVKDGKVIAKAYNKRETSQLSTSHAEILAIQKACRKVKSWRLVGCEMYVTLEPCIMCAGALVLARVEKVYFGACDPKAGAVFSIANTLDNKKYNHQVLYEGGILEDACSGLLSAFFKKLRNKKTIDKTESL